MLARAGGFHQPDLQPIRRLAPEPHSQIFKLQRVEETRSGGKIEMAAQAVEQVVVLGGVFHERGAA